MSKNMVLSRNDASGEVYPSDGVGNTPTAYVALLDRVGDSEDFFGDMGQAAREAAE